MNFESVIGLEVHAQLLTETKIFCGCSTRFGVGPNENTCPVCLGLPGALPVLNSRVVELGLVAAAALECEIVTSSIFARKNYFYPDLPKGYQISQYDRPLAIDGRLQLTNGRTIRIKRIHMEEDAGKLLHEGVEAGAEASYVDLNRAGVPLIEIVTEPDLRNPEEAYEYLTELKAILRFTKVSLANMEEGNLRCDANISLRPENSTQLGTKVEIKNLNSFKNVQKALEHEMARQANALKNGEAIVQETRLYDAERDVTQSMRSKEEAQDYRYFPDPDLLPCRIPEEQKQRVLATLPELPASMRQRMQSEFALGPKEAATLADDPERAARFYESARLSKNSRQAANWILRAPDAPLSARQIADLIALVHEGNINTDQAKTVFDEMISSGKSPAEIVREKGLSQISGEEEIGRIVDSVLAAQPDVAQRYRNGETKLLGVLVGAVMKTSRGKANPAVVNALLKKKLEES